jgi:hypothetical protein
MGSALVKKFTGKVPPGLETLFKDPPLVGDEKREDYESLFSAFVATVMPSDAIVWVYVRDITDLTWEIQRSKNLRTRVIKSAYCFVVSRLLSTSQSFSLALPSPSSVSTKKDKEAKQWADDPEARQRIDKELAQKGYDASYISTAASIRAANLIEAIDRRIAIDEVRRAMALRTMGQYSEASARRLAASVDVIEGESEGIG